MNALAGATNRLIAEKSPYLLQHARNPVNWYPWGSEALALARRQDRPILLSIGYSTCHWCHVMARESFQDPDVARRMNRYFVCIKLDREERPDLDRLYMTAVTALTGSGGWPLNVFLTPDLKPFFGGTYFPPQRRPGMAAWPDLLDLIAQHWNDPERRRRILESAEAVSDAVRQHLTWQTAAAGDAARLTTAARQSIARRYDPVHGGFGHAPKFPAPAVQTFLLADTLFAGDRGVKGTSKAAGLQMAETTLRRMAAGGIYDQVGGGFHRYSVDERWHVPHFEKMLYDNAQLATALLDTYLVTGAADLARVAADTLAYVLRDLSSPGGGFYAAEDADSPTVNLTGGDHGREGAFYVWTMDEIERILGPAEAALWADRYGMRPDGNVVDDPHGELRGQNVLYVARDLDAVARRAGCSADQARQRLAAARQLLFRARRDRPRPHRDEKVLVEWNGLMITALARASQVLVAPGSVDPYIEAAAKAARFIRLELYDAVRNRLKRRWCDGQAAMDGVAADYAFLAQGLLDMYAATLEEPYLRWAERLGDALLDRFYDRPTGGIYMTDADAATEAPLARIREDTDNVTPSAASVASLVLLRLARLTGREEFSTAARAAIDAVLARLAGAPEAAPLMLVAAAAVRSTPLDIRLSGSPQDVMLRRLAAVAGRIFAPGKTVQHMAHRPDDPLPDNRSGGGPAPPAAHICYAHTCHPAVSDPEAMVRQIRALFKDAIPAGVLERSALKAAP